VVRGDHFNASKRPALTAGFSARVNYCNTLSGRVIALAPPALEGSNGISPGGL
jgi:hypothetical protein